MATVHDRPPEAEAHETIAVKTQLRLVVAGSVDDGKSTLVGRILHDTKTLLADQYDAVVEASRRRGASEVDLALLTDGLRAEREQGITIDVAYRYFSTPRRSFVLADTPGHTQYTRNTVTGASTADAAVVLVDARKGVAPQTRRHIAIMALLRVPHLVVVVNKMDATSWDRETFEAVTTEARRVAAGVGLEEVAVIPISALRGWNVVKTGPPTGCTSDAASGDGKDPTAWYKGPCLLEFLESLGGNTRDTSVAVPFRMPVQLVIRPRTAEHPDYRGLAGRVASGSVAVDDAVVALPSGATSRIAAIDTPTGPADWAAVGESVTIRLADELDIGRGQVLALADRATQPRVTTTIDGVLCWLTERPGGPGSRTLLKAGTTVVGAILTRIGDRWDADEAMWSPSSDPLALNDIARVSVQLLKPVAVDNYAENRGTGGFLIIDPSSGDTLAAGMVGSPFGAGDNGPVTEEHG